MNQKDYRIRKQTIETVYKRNYDILLKELYVDKKMSGVEISEEFHNTAKVKILPRSIQRQLKDLGLTRDRSQARFNAIKSGRMSYEPFKKAIKSNELRKGITLKNRYEVLKRDNFKCVLCGRAAQDDALVIDHINPVVKGGNNTLHNLRTLCRACNHGKMISEQEK